MLLSRFVLPAVLVLGSAVPFVTPAVAQAHEPYRHEHRHHHRHCYDVFYRSDACCPWRCYGRFDDRFDAGCAAERLERAGYEVFIGR
jgi:hypothetical protein